MPKHTASRVTATLRGPYGLTPAENLERNRLIWGDARMEDTGDGDPQGEDNTQDGSATPPTDASVSELLTYLEENNLKPGQIQGRLEAGKRWEARAKASDTVAREDYDKVVAERDELRGTSQQQSPPTPDSDALEAARQEGARQQRESDFEASAAAMLRVALRARGITKDDDLEEFVATTNLAAFKGSDDELDDEKVVKLANRLAGTASEWPDMGQDRERPDRKSGLEAGREAYRSRHRK